MKIKLSVLLILSLMLSLAAACGSAEVAVDDGVDIDLTLLSNTMLLAEMSNIMARQGDYIGKTIKINGLYYASYYDETRQFYHYVVIMDETACCPMYGLEFVLSGDKSYPDDYPRFDDKIEITGVFGSYEEMGELYYYLSADEVVLIG